MQIKHVSEIKDSELEKVRTKLDSYINDPSYLSEDNHSDLINTLIEVFEVKKEADKTK